MFVDPGIWFLGLVDLGLLLLAGIVFFKEPARGLNRSLATLCVLTAGWVTTAYLEDAVTSPDLTRFLVGVDFALGSLMCAAFLGFAALFALKRPSRLLLVGPWVVAGLLSSLSTVGSGIITGVERQPGGLAFQTGPFFVLYATVIIGYVTAGIILVSYKVLKTRGIERLQGQFMLLGLFLSSAVIVVTNLILPRVVETPATVSRLGSFSVILFLGATVYAIVRHRLLDIRLVVARSLAYFLLISILGGGYASGLFLLQAQFFHQDVGGLQVLSSSLLALVMAFTFQPLRRLLERGTDRVFFRDRYDQTELIASLAKTVSSTIVLDTLTKRVLDELVESMRLGGGAIVVQDREEHLLIQNRKLLTKRLALADIEAFLHRHETTVFDDLPEGRRKALLRSLGVAVVTPLETRDGVIGLILLGGKRSGDPFSDSDLEVLQILAPELTVGIENARAYHQIERFNETLRLKVERATRKLREANSHLRELDKAKDEFISLASHQLRTPLTAIKGYLSMTTGGDAGKLTARQSEFIGIAAEGAERMASLIDDLLNVSRMDAGRFLLEKAPTDLREVVEQEVRELQPHADARHLELIYHKPKERIPILSLDGTKTRQVVINFIDNAIYYTEEGKVEVFLEKVGENVEFRVVDTGIGIAPADQEKLFSKFYRAENAREVRPDGTGLGLYLAKRVVEEQGGEVIFESALGQGSTFGFRFPVAKATRRSLTKPIVAAYHRRRAKQLV